MRRLAFCLGFKESSLVTIPFQEKIIRISKAGTPWWGSMRGVPAWKGTRGEGGVTGDRKGAVKVQKETQKVMQGVKRETGQSEGNEQQVVNLKTKEDGTWEFTYDDECTNFFP